MTNYFRKPATSGTGKEIVYYRRRSPLGFLTGLAFGAGALYFLDPNSGRRRWSVVRDKAFSYVSKFDRAIEGIVQDLNNRVGGAKIEFEHFIHPEKEVPDRVLTERVRAKLGRVVTHPRAVHVEVSKGHVALSGKILTGEITRLLAAIYKVRGVAEVENKLESVSDATGIPELQGESRPADYI